MLSRAGEPALLSRLGDRVRPVVGLLQRGAGLQGRDCSPLARGVQLPGDRLALVCHEGALDELGEDDGGVFDRRRGIHGGQDFWPGDHFDQHPDFRHVPYLLARNRRFRKLPEGTRCRQRAAAVFNSLERACSSSWCESEFAPRPQPRTILTAKERTRSGRRDRDPNPVKCSRSRPSRRCLCFLRTLRFGGTCC